MTATRCPQCGNAYDSGGELSHQCSHEPDEVCREIDELRAQYPDKPASAPGKKSPPYELARYFHGEDIVVSKADYDALKAQLERVMRDYDKNDPLQDYMAHAEREANQLRAELAEAKEMEAMHFRDLDTAMQERDAALREVERLREAIKKYMPLPHRPEILAETEKK